MLNYSASISNSTSLDLFQGGGSTGKWVVQFWVPGNYAGMLQLSTDGSTPGADIVDSGTSIAPQYKFIVENQPLYLINSTGGAITVSVVITPVLDSKITTC